MRLPATGDVGPLGRGRERVYKYIDMYVCRCMHRYTHVCLYMIQVTWDRSVEGVSASTFKTAWLRQHCFAHAQHMRSTHRPRRHLWGAELGSLMPSLCVPYGEVMHEDAALLALPCGCGCVWVCVGVGMGVGVGVGVGWRARVRLRVNVCRLSGLFACAWGPQ